MSEAGARELKNRISEIEDDEELEDYVLSHHPHFVALRERAREAIRKGEFVTSQELRALLEE